MNSLKEFENASSETVIETMISLQFGLSVSKTHLCSESETRSGRN